ESYTWIDFRRKRLRGCRPGNAVGVGTAVTEVTTAEIAGVFHGELKSRQYGVVHPLWRDQLIDRDAEIRTDSISAWPSAREDACAAGMVACGLFQSGRGRCGIKSCNKDDAITERLQRFRDEREFEVLAFLQRAPITRCGPVWMPYAHKASHFVRACRRLALGCLSGQHRLQEGQCNRCAGTAKKRAARNVFLCYEHLSGLLKGPLLFKCKNQLIT